MKFVLAVVLLAVVLGTEASVVGWVPWAQGVYAPGLGSGTWDGRSWNSLHGDWSGHGSWDDGQWHEGAWGNHGSWGGPVAAWGGPVAVAAHAAVIPAAHAAWGHEGSYVAKTRGAVHVAPLAGHANSATSINVQPAPGTV